MQCFYLWSQSGRRNLGHYFSLFFGKHNLFLDFSGLPFKHYYLPYPLSLHRTGGHTLHRWQYCQHRQWQWGEFLDSRWSDPSVTWKSRKLQWCLLSHALTLGQHSHWSGLVLKKIKKMKVSTFRRICHHCMWVEAVTKTLTSIQPASSEKIATGAKPGSKEPEFLSTFSVAVLQFQRRCGRETGTHAYISLSKLMSKSLPGRSSSLSVPSKGSLGKCHISVLQKLKAASTICPHLLGGDAYV